MNAPIFKSLFFNSDGGAAGGGGQAGVAGAGGAGAGAAAGAAGGGATGGAAGAGAGGAGAGGPAGGQAGAGQGAVDWISGIQNEELRGYTQNKGWKDPSSVIESYRGLEKLMGVPQDQILKLPKDAAAPEWNDVYKRLGRPDSPEGYSMPALDKGGDPEFTKWAQGAFHGANLTAKQAETLVGKWNEYGQGILAKQEEARQLALKGEDESLKKEWGAAHDQNKELARRAAAKFGLDAKIIDGLEALAGKAGVYKFLHKIGEATGEGTFIEGNGNSGGRVSTPAQAAAKLEALKSDKAWFARWSAGGKAEIAEMTALIQMMNPEEKSA